MNSITSTLGTRWPQALTTTVQRWSSQSPACALICALGAVCTLGLALDRPYITTDAEAHALIALYEAADMAPKPLFPSDNRIVRANRIAAWFETDEGQTAALHCNAIDLSNRGLTKLPREIGLFNNLTSLHLQNNLLEAIPPTIKDLGNLRDLRLEHNRLQALPSTIGNLGNLQYLWIAHNQLQALPPTIGNLGNLRGLCLKHNQLQALPSTIGNLGNLRSLGLSHNHLQTLPPAIGNLDNLQRLWLEQNQLEEIPCESIERLLPHCHIYIQNNRLRLASILEIPGTLRRGPHWHID